MTLSLLNNILSIVFWIIYMLTVPTMLHVMQQESYQNDGMIRWIQKNPKRAFKRNALLFLGTTVIFIVATLIMILIAKSNAELIAANYYLRFIPCFLGMAFYVVTGIVFFIKEHKERKNAKKPLKYTARAKRLYVYNFLVIVIIQVFFLQSYQTFYPKEITEYMSIVKVSRMADQIPESDPERDEKIYDLASKYSEATAYDLEKQAMYMPILAMFLTLTLPLNMIIANWFASPLEAKIAEKYVRKAYKKLCKKEYEHLIRIGITGSYGKTSTKYILKTILEEKYKVLATPGSYNTTMGNVRVIREQLEPEHEIFISEMGARKKRDIKEICDFVYPHIGIITSIGEQHLETFKNIANIKKTKGELLKGTLSDGAVFLPKFNQYCLELYNEDKHENKFLYSTQDDGSDIFAKDIKASVEGSTFTIVSKTNGTYDCKTKLLGEHNVQNIVGAVAIAEYLGLTKEQIQKGIEKIEPVEHRLQILPSTNGTTVIDDAFNSNPIGSKAALDVIKQFEGRKIIITPGMVELGKEEDNLNKEFGRQMAEAVDIAILVGPRHTKPIEEGLKEKGFDDMSIYVVKDLDDATKTLGRISKKGDVILFENDLPDAYNE